jgi:tol-pal system protein YbgF
LNGSLEVATHDADQSRRETAALQAQVKALAERLAAVEQKQAEAAAPPPPPEPPPEAAPTISAADALAKARVLMNSGDYDAAEAAFANIVAAYPNDPKTPEASYWWGRTLAVRGDHIQAAGAFIAAIRGWPQTPWAPEAVVELSRSLIALKKPVDACQTLAEFSRRYPKAAPAVASRAAAARVQAKCTAG